MFLQPIHPQPDITQRPVRYPHTHSVNGNPRSLLYGILESPTGHQSDYVYTEHHTLKSHRNSTPNPTSSHSCVTRGKSLNLSGFQVPALQGRWWDELGGFTV